LLAKGPVTDEEGCASAEQQEKKKERPSHVAKTNPPDAGPASDTRGHP
jgi:hypothetical protein